MTENYFDGLLDQFEKDFSNNKQQQNNGNNASKKVSSNTSNITSKNSNKSTSVLDSIIENQHQNKKNHKDFYKGIYFDEDIYKVLTNLTQTKDGGRRNIQSQLVNECLREVFTNRNLL